MDPRNRVEWVVLVISAMAVSAVVALLIVDGLTRTGSPPQPVVTLHPDKAYRLPAGWLLPATASNEGDRSAQSVTLLATATVGGKEETAEVAIDYLPAGTDVEVTFGFSGEPDGEIIVRVAGFLP